MQKAHFNNIRSKIIPLLRKSKMSVNVAMAWFTSAELFAELLNCLNRGVSVQLILLNNAINFMEYAPDFNEFIKAGGKLYIASEDVGFLHHKFCIIDHSCIVTGSYNWTYYAEIRNIENILISDDNDVVEAFQMEFKRIIEQIKVVDKSPRLCWEQIELLDDIDINQINYETEKISKIQNKPVRKIIETRSQVIITEIDRKAVSAFNIGVAAKENDKFSFKVLICKGSSLPKESEEILLYYNSKVYNHLYCQFIYGPSNIIEKSIPLIEDDFNEVVGGVISDCLHIRFKMNLDVNGDLRIEVGCVETGIKKIITVLNNKFINYE